VLEDLGDRAPDQIHAVVDGDAMVGPAHEATTTQVAGLIANRVRSVACATPRYLVDPPEM
jgi:hypothetical protein